MNAGVYRSATGLIAEEVRLEAIADNIANYSMPGYKKNVAVSGVFRGTLNDALSNNNGIEDGAKADAFRVDFTQGPMRQTVRSLDFAIDGDAFFVVYSDDKPFYTRNGAFQVDAEGNLLTGQGHRVGGNITLPSDVVMDDINVEPETGVVRNGALALGTLETARFEDVHQLQKVGPGLFEAPAHLEPEQSMEGNRILNRMLEASNSEIFTEMTEMILCMRNFEACQKMIQMQDAAEGQMISRMST